MKKYFAWAPFNEIKLREIAKETKTYVVFANGNRAAKRSDGQGYFDTWQEAHVFLIKESESDISKLREQLSRAEKKWVGLKEMQEPTA